MVLATRAAVVAVAIAVAGCAGVQSALEPSGPAAARIAHFWWIMLAATLVPAVLVIGMALYAVRRAQTGRGAGLGLGDTTFVLVGGAAIPLAILVYLLVTNVRIGGAVTQPPAEPALTVEVVGHQYWWEVRYPAHDIVTANEIHIPVDVPVEVRVTASDVIHSFWVPRLAGKLDAIPGHVNVLRIEADAPGRYAGLSAEFSGEGYLNHRFEVVAHDPASWIAFLAGETP